MRQSEGTSLSVILLLNGFALQPRRDSEDNINARRDVCRECHDATRNERFLRHPCKGFTVRSEAEKCPKGKW